MILIGDLDAGSGADGAGAATVGLTDAVEGLAGRRPAAAGPGPKIHIDPRA